MLNAYGLIEDEQHMIFVPSLERLTAFSRESNGVVVASRLAELRASARGLDL